MMASEFEAILKDAEQVAGKREFGKGIGVEVVVYGESKYESDEVPVRMPVKGVAKMAVAKLPDEWIYGRGYDEVDENGEYIVMELVDGRISMLRNTHCDVFRIE